jgi:hypothetical protein
LAKINILILLLNCSNGENQRSGTHLVKWHIIFLKTMSMFISDIQTTKRLWS